MTIESSWVFPLRAYLLLCESLPEGKSHSTHHFCWFNHFIPMKRPPYEPFFLVLGYECNRCHQIQPIPHPMYRSQRGPREYSNWSWACHRGCNDYTHWRIIPQDASQVGPQGGSILCGWLVVFLEHDWMIFPFSWEWTVINPTDEVLFFRGVEAHHQPGGSCGIWKLCMILWLRNQKITSW